MSASPDLAAAIEELWRGFRSLAVGRVGTLQTCASWSGPLPEELRARGEAAAHQLAGSLDSYGRTGGSALAADIESLLHQQPGTHGERLADRVRRLTVIVEGP